jgi:hypothetical protein
MTDCCLLVCFRPRTYDRLIKDLYPKGASGHEKNLTPNKLSRLTSYLCTYPYKVDLICHRITQNIKNEILKNRIGFLKINIEALQSFMTQSNGKSVHIPLEHYIHVALHDILLSKNDKLLLLGSKLFITYCNEYSRCFLSPYIKIILFISIRQMQQLSIDSNTEEQNATLEMLLKIIEILRYQPGSIEAHCTDIVTIIYHYFSSNKISFVETSQTNLDCAQDWMPRSSGILSALCLVSLGSVSTPTTFTHILNALFVKLDDAMWEPQVLALKALFMLSATNAALNYYSNTSVSHLLTHANAVVINSLEWNKLNPTFSFRASARDLRHLNIQGSETAQRSALRRAHVLRNILQCGKDLIQQCQDPYSLKLVLQNKPKDKQLHEIRHDSIVIEAIICKDIENILSILCFCGQFSNEAAISCFDLPKEMVSIFRENLITDEPLSNWNSEWIDEIDAEKARKNLDFSIQSICSFCVRIILDLTRVQCVSVNRAHVLQSILDTVEKYIFETRSKLIIFDRVPQSGSEQAVIQGYMMHGINAILYAGVKPSEVHESFGQINEQKRSFLHFLSFCYDERNKEVQSTPFWGERLAKWVLSNLGTNDLTLFNLCVSCISHVLKVVENPFSPKSQSSSRYAITFNISIDVKLDVRLNCMLNAVYDQIILSLVKYREDFHAEFIATCWSLQVRVKYICYDFFTYISSEKSF